MRFWKFVFMAAFVAAGVGAAPDAWAQRNRGGQSASVIVIDYARIIESSDIGRDLTTKLNQIGQQMQGEIQPDMTSLQTEQQSIAQATQGMTADQVRRNSALNTRVEQFSQRLEQVRGRREGLARDLEYTRQMTIADFNQQITPIVREVMEARGAGVVLDAAAAQLTLPAFNATDDVVQRLNQRLRTINVTRRSAPAPQQQPTQP